MIFEGTENMPRYPWMKGSDLMGFVSYGAKKMPDGSRAYKADPNHIERFKQAGWRIVGSGTSYIYVQQNKTEG